MPQLVVVASRSAEKPADVKVRFHATGASGDRVVIVHPGGSAGSALRSKYTDGAVDGTLRFGTDGLAPGYYPAALVHPGRRHRVPVAVLALAAGAEPTVRTSRRLYTSGNPIRVSWTNGPGHEVGLARNLQGRRAPRIRTPRPARPTHVRTGTTSSTSTRTRRSRARRGRRRFVATGYTTWPLGPGTYRLRLLVDDGDKSVAVSPKFKIVKP